MVTGGNGDDFNQKYIISALIYNYDDGVLSWAVAVVMWGFLGIGREN